MAGARSRRGFLSLLAVVPGYGIVRGLLPDALVEAVEASGEVLTEARFVTDVLGRTFLRVQAGRDGVAAHDLVVWEDNLMLRVRPWRPGEGYSLAMVGVALTEVAPFHFCHVQTSGPYQFIYGRLRKMTYSAGESFDVSKREVVRTGTVEEFVRIRTGSEERREV